VILTENFESYFVTESEVNKNVFIFRERWNHQPLILLPFIWTEYSSCGGVWEPRMSGSHLVVSYRITV
jgi:hypothetical protein